LSHHNLGSNYIWTLPVPNPSESNSALTYYVHYGSYTNQRNRVLSALLTQIISEPAFNILRTKEQLGYIVSASTWVLPGDAEAGLRIAIQSERTPTYLENRVEVFIEHMKDVIEEISDENFAEQKAGLRTKWHEAPKNLSEETSRFWTHIDSGYLDFLRRRGAIILHTDKRLMKINRIQRRRVSRYRDKGGDTRPLYGESSSIFLHA
jgi:insulysin